MSELRDVIDGASAVAAMGNELCNAKGMSELGDVANGANGVSALGYMFGGVSAVSELKNRSGNTITVSELGDQLCTYSVGAGDVIGGTNAVSDPGDVTVTGGESTMILLGDRIAGEIGVSVLWGVNDSGSCSGVSVQGNMIGGASMVSELGTVLVNMLDDANRELEIRRLIESAWAVTRQGYLISSASIVLVIREMIQIDGASAMSVGGV